MKNEIVLVGLGGHAKAVLDLKSFSTKSITSYIDKRPMRDNLGLSYLGDKVTNDIIEIFKILPGFSYYNFHTRERHYNVFGEWNSYHFCDPIIDESARIGNDSRIGNGTVVFPGVIIGRNVEIGEGCVINSGSIIEHNSIVKRFTHVAPSATICGNVSIGQYSLIGANCTIINGLEICDYAIVRAGEIILEAITND